MQENFQTFEKKAPFRSQMGLEQKLRNYIEEQKNMQELSKSLAARALFYTAIKYNI
jgi:hypothetical protein